MNTSAQKACFSILNIHVTFWNGPHFVFGRGHFDQMRKLLSQRVHRLHRGDPLWLEDVHVHLNRLRVS